MIDFMIVFAIFAGGLFFSWRYFAEGRVFVFPIFFLLVMIWYCWQDMRGGIGRKIMGIAVRCRDNSNVTPSRFKMFYRNFIGDKRAGTAVYNVKKVKPIKVAIIAIALPVFFVSSLTFGINTLFRNSDSFQVAASYIEANEEIRTIVGEITGYGFFVQGSVQLTDGYGTAEYFIRVIGEENYLRVRIWLERRPGRNWEVIDILY